MQHASQQIWNKKRSSDVSIVLQACTRQLVNQDTPYLTSTSTSADQLDDVTAVAWEDAVVQVVLNGHPILCAPLPSFLEIVAHLVSMDYAAECALDLAEPLSSLQSRPRLDAGTGV